MIEWLDVAKATAEGFGLSAPVVATLWLFHKKRNERYDRIDEAHTTLKNQVRVLNIDFDGLRGQLAASDLQNEKRFVSRQDHTEAVNRLDESIRELNRTLLGQTHRGSIR